MNEDVEVFLDETPGETRGVIRRSGRYEQLLIQRHDEEPRHRLEARCVGRIIEINPGLTPDGITVSCTGERLDEVRICLTRDLQPRPCAPDSRRDCRARMLMEAPG